MFSWAQYPDTIRYEYSNNKNTNININWWTLICRYSSKTDKFNNVYIMNGWNHKLSKGSDIMCSRKSENVLPRMYHPLRFTLNGNQFFIVGQYTIGSGGFRHLCRKKPISHSNQCHMHIFSHSWWRSHYDTNTEINIYRYTCHKMFNKKDYEMFKYLGYLSTRVWIQHSPFRLGVDSDTCAEINPSRTTTTAYIYI